MIEAAIDGGVKRLVHGNTIGVYGISKNGPVQDESPLQPDSIYGITKLAGKNVVSEYFDDLPISIMNICQFGVAQS